LYSWQNEAKIGNDFKGPAHRSRAARASVNAGIIPATGQRKFARGGMDPPDFGANVSPR